MEMEQRRTKRRRVEWPSDGQVYSKQAANGATLIGPSSALIKEQKQQLKQWGKFSVAQLAYEGPGEPPIATTSLDAATSSSSPAAVDMDLDEPHTLSTLDFMDDFNLDQDASVLLDVSTGNAPRIQPQPQPR